MRKGQIVLVLVGLVLVMVCAALAQEPAKKDKILQINPIKETEDVNKLDVEVTYALSKEYGPEVFIRAVPLDQEGKEIKVTAAPEKIKKGMRMVKLSITYNGEEPSIQGKSIRINMYYLEAKKENVFATNDFDYEKNWEKPDALAKAPAPVPVIKAFKAEKSILTKGDCTVLRWEFTGEGTVSLNKEAIEGTSKEVCPEKTTKYVLVVTNKDGASAISTVSIRITPKK